jgi:putative lipoprotein
MKFRPRISSLSSWIAIGVVVTLASGSCKGGGTAPKASPAGATWRVEEIDGHGVADAAKTELRISSDGRVSGSTGCNRFSGTATLEGPSLTFSPLATTRMACEQPLMDQERDILAGLEAVKSFSLDGDGKLRLLDTDGKTRLRLTRAE